LKLVAADYPRNGLAQEGWCKLTPARIESGGGWCAYVLEFDCTERTKGYFLDTGLTDLDIDEIEFGDVVIKCIGGYVYLISESGIAVLPSNALGYTQMVVSEDALAFSNFLELLVIHCDGVVRHAYSIVVDNLEIVSLENSEIRLTGMLTPGGDDERWSLDLEDIPVVKVAFL
jgi:hypothetical protein